MNNESADTLPHPKILETLADMEAQDMLTPEAREAARKALAEIAPDRVRPVPMDLSERLIQDLMEDRGFTQAEAEEAVKEDEEA